MHIPFDVVSLVLQHACTDLDPLDLSSVLRSSSLVCQEWRVTLQPLLYSEFARYKPYYSADLFLKTLRDHPHLVHLVKCLWIDTNWLYSLSNIDFISTVVPHVRELAIFYKPAASSPSHITISGVSDVNIRIRALAPSFSHITFLCLSGLVRVPVDVFHHFPALQILYIQSCSIFQPVAADDAATHQSKLLATRPRLNELSCEGNQSLVIVNWFLDPSCAFDLSKLKKFVCNDVATGRDSFAFVQPFIERYGSTLEDVLLSPQEKMVNKGSRCEVAQYLTSVKTLRLSTCQWPSLSFLGIPWIMGCLSDLPHPEILEYLYLPTHFLGDGPFGTTHSHHWSQLDDLLTSDDPPSRFSSFKEVWVSIARPGLSHEFEMELQEMLPKLMPKLRERKMLRVTMSNAIGYMTDWERWTQTRD